MTQFRENSQGTGDSNPEELGRIEMEKWLQAAVGKKKGRVYGIGSLATCIRKGASQLVPNSSSSSSNSTTRSRQPDPDPELRRELLQT